MLSLQVFVIFCYFILLSVFGFPFLVKQTVNFHCWNLFPFKHILKELLTANLIINTSFLLLKQFVKSLIIINLHLLAPIEILKPLKKGLNCILSQINPCLICKINLFQKIINFNHKNFGNV
jgi:hypothetical protein